MQAVRCERRAQLFRRDKAEPARVRMWPADYRPVGLSALRGADKLAEQSGKRQIASRTRQLSRGDECQVAQVAVSSGAAACTAMPPSPSYSMPS